MRAYRVAATFKVGMYEYDSTFVFMPLAAAQVYFRMKGAVTNLEVMVEKASHAPRVGRAIAGAITANIFWNISFGFSRCLNSFIFSFEPSH